MGGGRHRWWFSALSFLVFFSLGCSGAAPAPRRAADPPLSPEAERLLNIIENEDLDIRKRTTGVYQLRQLRERGIIDRLGSLLPREPDALANEIVIALGETEDRRSIPYIERMYERFRVPGSEIPGKLNANMSWAIKNCSK